ncbi:protein Lines homolog 1 isoform X2 [Hypanus sabinus]|uniref:protein Lines homolog 1 isoform X2 n=1 Tax=Hypanus sabinus TaxID=79690 RepID=UPI0028C4D4AA|nr:protein Lines homolog 1 isoform X2 [Hypanus sabinus]
MMEKCFISLRQVYSELLAGVKPSKDSHELAVFLSPETFEQESVSSIETKKNNLVYHFRGCSLRINGNDTQLENHSSANDGQNEIFLLQMNMIHLMSSKLYSEILRQDVRKTYLKSVTILLEDMKIISKLALLFDYQDKLLSHMAMKCVASLILVQILLTLSIDSWMNNCLDILSKKQGSRQSAHWLQTITVVIKEILKGKSQDKTGILQKLLKPVDSVFHNLYFFTFSPHSGACQTSEGCTGSNIDSIATTNQFAVIQALEVFVAIRNQLELNLPCIRTLYLHAPLMLDFVTSSAQYFIKKRLILLLKSCILGCASADANSPCHAVSQQDRHIHNDLMGVSCILLQAVTSGWLRQVPVSPRPCFFGGSEILGAEHSIPGPDMVMLRAVSLIVIKAMETNLKNAVGAVTDKGCLKNELQACVSQLMLFLRRHLQNSAQFQQLSHPCAWVSFIFLEQDDDLVEVVSALLTIYMHSYGSYYCGPERTIIYKSVKRIEAMTMETDKANYFVLVIWTQGWRYLDNHPEEKAATSQETCEQWFDPHGIFLLLLQNLAFDHRVLLDFLISSETCFLEYLVRYLRLLRRDWQSFCYTCAQFDATPEPFSPPPVNEVCDSHRFTVQVEQDGHTLSEDSRKAFVSPQIPLSHLPKKKPWPSHNPRLVMNSERTQLVSLPQSLVDYDSSENSESDEGETIRVNTASPGDSEGDFERSNTETTNKEAQHRSETTGSIKGINSHSCEKNPEVELSLEGMFKKSTGCLIELRKAIGRLQGRNLFPYNATPLLKRLLDIEACHKNDAVSE